MWAVFTRGDATLVEVNPGRADGDGRVIALDAKVTLDDNAAFRQDFGQFATRRRPTRARQGQGQAPQLRQADRRGRHHRNGAGLVMSTLDVVAYAGRVVRGVRPATSFGLRRGASAESWPRPGHRAVDPSVSSVLVNVFAGSPGDAVPTGSCRPSECWRSGASRSATRRGPAGGNGGRGRQSQRRGIAGVEQVGTMDDAARRAAELAAAAVTGA